MVPWGMVFAPHQQVCAHVGGLGIGLLAAMKYWVTQAGTLALLLVLSEKFVLIQGSTPLFAWIASAAVLAEKVETTASRFVIRILGTAVGATVGYLVMYDAALAGAPVALAAIFRLAVVITMVSVIAVIMCQYQGCCDSAGTVKYYVTRMTAVTAGAVGPSLVNQLVLPWYLSEWAMETLAEVYVDSIRVISSCYEASYLQAKARVTVDLIRSHSVPTLGHRGPQRTAETLEQGSWPVATRPPADPKARPHAVPGTHPDPDPTSQGRGVRSPGGPVVGSATAFAAAAHTDRSSHHHPACVTLDIAASAAVPPAPPPSPPPRAASAPPPPPPPPQPPPHHHQKPPGCRDPGQRAAAGGRSLLARLSGPVLAVLPARLWPPAAAAQVGEAAGSVGRSPGCVCPKTAAEIQTALRSTVTDKLSAVKASLAKDSVLWTRGAYVTPQAVHNMAAVLQVLADRLAALELSLHVQPMLPAAPPAHTPVHAPVRTQPRGQQQGGSPRTPHAAAQPPPRVTAPVLSAASATLHAADHAPKPATHPPAACAAGPLSLSSSGPAASLSADRATLSSAKRGSSVVLDASGVPRGAPHRTSTGAGPQAGQVPLAPLSPFASRELQVRTSGPPAAGGDGHRQARAAPPPDQLQQHALTVGGAGAAGVDPLSLDRVGRVAARRATFAEQRDGARGTATVVKEGSEDGGGAGQADPAAGVHALELPPVCLTHARGAHTRPIDARSAPAQPFLSRTTACPVSPQLQQTVQLLTELAVLTSHVMTRRRPASPSEEAPAARLSSLLLRIEQHRLAFHWHFHRLRQEMHQAARLQTLMSGARVDTNPHDMIAFLSSLFALTKAADACMAVARTAEAIHCHART
ncbi:MAG: hypothetical protein WDW38_011164 [Sanguina aurantia]